MPKVTFSNAQGINQEAGSGFQVNDAAITPEAETLAASATIAVTVSEDTLSDTNNGYFLIADASDSRWHVWLNVAAAGVDPDPLPTISTAIPVAYAQGANLAAVAAAVATAVDGETEFSASTDGVDTVTITCLEIGKINASDLVSVGSLTGLDGATGEYAIAVTNSSGTSALQTFGVSNIAYSNAEVDAATANVVGTATLAATTAGAKKLVVHPGALGGGSLVLTYPGADGSSTTATFNAQYEWIYLLSNGSGWVTLGTPTTS